MRLGRTPADCGTTQGPTPKYCTGCGKDKSLDDFNKRNAPRGFNRTPRCKPCMKKMNAEPGRRQRQEQLQRAARQLQKRNAKPKPRTTKARLRVVDQEREAGEQRDRGQE